MKAVASLSNIKPKIKTKKKHAFDAQAFSRFSRRGEKNSGVRKSTEDLLSR
jgi:hypothetical protein